MTAFAPSAATLLPECVTHREWVGLAILALPCILYAMDLTVLNLAVPALSIDLKPTAAQLLWIVDIYGFLAAGSLLIMGALGDRIGRRKLLLAGSFVFGLVTFAAAFAHSAAWLILARALLGIAGATMAPSTLSLIMRNTKQRERWKFSRPTNSFMDVPAISIANRLQVTLFKSGSVPTVAFCDVQCRIGA